MITEGTPKKSARTTTQTSTHLEMSMVQHQMPRSPRSDAHSRSPSGVHPQFNPSLSTYVQTQESYNTQYYSSQAQLVSPQTSLPTSPQRSPRQKPRPAPEARASDPRTSYTHHHHHHHHQKKHPTQTTATKKSKPQQPNSPRKEEKPAQSSVPQPETAVGSQVDQSTIYDDWLLICCRTSNPNGNECCCCCCCDGDGNEQRSTGYVVGHHHHTAHNTSCCQDECCETDDCWGCCKCGEDCKGDCCDCGDCKDCGDCDCCDCDVLLKCFEDDN